MKHFLVVLVLVSGVGCAVTRNARLYDLDGREPLVVATYKSNGSGHGPIWIGASLESSQCKGEYVTVAPGTVGWGAIYSGTTTTTGIGATMSATQPGSAILNCTDGRVIQCEYVTSEYTQAGTGACQDNNGRRYRAMF